jgi:hypothetical protein
MEKSKVQTLIKSPLCGDYKFIIVTPLRTTGIFPNVGE